MKFILALLFFPVTYWKSYLQKREEKKQQEKIQQRYERLITWTRDRFREYESRTAYNTCPKLRALQRTLNHYEQVTYLFHKGSISHHMVLYPLVFSYRFRMWGFDLQELWGHALITQPDKHRFDSNFHDQGEVARALADALWYGEDIDWIDNHPCSEEVAIDFLTTFQDRFYEYLEEEENQQRTEKQKRIESQKNLLTPHLSSFDTLRCPSCNKTYFIPRKGTLSFLFFL